MQVSVDSRTSSSYIVAHISTFATRTMTSLNWLCSHASADRSIIASAALSYVIACQQEYN